MGFLIAHEKIGDNTLQSTTRTLCHLIQKLYYRELLIYIAEIASQRTTSKKN